MSLVLRSDLGILLLQRGRPYAEFLGADASAQTGIGLWELPGGGLDFGETPLGAGVRETHEETGILIEERDLKLLACCAYTLKSVQCESHRIHVIYETSLRGPSQVRPSEEHVAYRWVRDSGEVQNLSMIAEIRKVMFSMRAPTR